MTKNLETADRIAKLTLSLMTMLFYFTGVIDGPFASVLMIVSIAILLIYFVKYFFGR
jgi:hypothetical protein